MAMSLVNEGPFIPSKVNWENRLTMLIDNCRLSSISFFFDKIIYLPFIYHLLLSFEFYTLKDYKPAYSRANLGGLYYLQLYLPCKK